MSEDIEFSPDSKSPPEAPTEKAKKESETFERAPSSPPNSMRISLWRGGHISFEPDSSSQIFAVVALILCLLTFIILGICGVWTVVGGGWLERAFTALGNVISAIVGAIVGTSVSSRSRRK